jgi:hypothetical protein
MQETNTIREINLLQIGSVSKLLEVLDRANLSDRELGELPFGVNSIFSRFFDAGLAQTKDNIIYFCCNEVGGCFCEPAYVLELNSWPEASKRREISNMLLELDRPGAQVQNLKGTLERIFYKLDVKTIKINEFQREELVESLIYELRTDISFAIDESIKKFLEIKIKQI